MKKLIIVLLLLIPITLQAYYYKYSNDVKAVYDFEDIVSMHIQDVTGNGYHLLSNGTVQSTEKVYNGTYSATANGNSENNFIMSLPLKAQLKTNSFTIQFRLYMPSGNIGSEIWFGQMYDTEPALATWTDATNNSPRLLKMQTNGVHSWNDTEAIDISFANDKWTRINYEFNSTDNYVKVYFDGIYKTRIYTFVINPLSNDTKELYFMRTYSGFGAMNGYIDNLIFSNKLYNGAEILPIGYSETKYFTPEEIIYFGADQIYYDGE
ncbi:MAG: hypothetical protein PHQ63_06400 [Smithellaceae bacterium]|nr:hypothetical protein [Smithellaceae bacterium]